MGFFATLFGKRDDSALTEAIASGALLVDVRTPAEFKTGSVKGATNIPLDRIGQHADKLRQKSQVVVFCRSGARSAQAKAVLERQGCQNVINGGALHRVSQALDIK